MKCKEFYTAPEGYIPGKDRLTIAPSYKCNLACNFCKVGHCVAGPNDDEIDVKHFLDFMEWTGSRNINITGGEPLYDTTKDKTYAIVQKAIDLKVDSILINTNGTIPIPDFNFECPDTMIMFLVSLDGLREEHDAIRGEGSFDKSTAFMQEMMDKGYLVSCHFVIKELPDPKKFAEYFGYIKSHKLVNTSMSLKWLRNVGLSRTDGDCFVKQYYENDTFPKDNFRDFLCSECVSLETVVRCKYEGMKDAYILNPNGDIVPCNNRGESGPVFGNITSFNYEQVQRNKKAFYDNSNCYNLKERTPDNYVLIRGNREWGNENFNQKFYGQEK
jgi:MoaA/NifB/PqqE/SkfB family radical SAM enzyme